MISAHTPPGTKVVALENVRHGRLRVVAGNVYTVKRMEISDNVAGDVCVVLDEVYHGPLTCNGFRNMFLGVVPEVFRYASLPSSLTSLLNSKPVDLPELVGG